MQQKYLYKKLKYASNGIDEREYSELAYKKYSKIKAYYDLKEQHCDEKIIFRVLEVPRSTFFRWKACYEKHGLIGLENASRAPTKVRQREYDQNLAKLILRIRKENPIWGKKKLYTILKRDYNIR